MKKFNADKIKIPLIILSFLLYVASMTIVKFDINFEYRWIAFWLHIASILLLLGIYILYTITKGYVKKLLSEKELIPIIFIFMVIESVNFLLLQYYPYVSISDELRDGGVYAMKIASGALKNIFAWGVYDAHGLIIPTLTVPFYYLFGNSTLTYRVPAALLSSADVIFLYILIRLLLNRQTAVWVALILATLPFHMFFAHTQEIGRASCR